MEPKKIGQCKQGCKICTNIYCERVKGRCHVCGKEFIMGELFTVDGMQMCLRCKAKKEEQEEIERMQKERLKEYCNLSKAIRL